MDPLIYLQNLSVPELEVEYLVRGLSSKATDANQILINSLVAERSEKSLAPKVSHKVNPDKELQVCASKYAEFSKVTLEEGTKPSIDFLTVAFAKTIHYKNRTKRLIDTIGETPQTLALFSNWRRAVNWCTKLWNEMTAVTTQPILSIPNSPGPITSSSFSDQIDNIIETQFPNITMIPNTSTVNHQSPLINEKAKTTTNSHVLKSGSQETKNTVRDFFSQAGDRLKQNMVRQNVNQKFNPLIPPIPGQRREETNDVFIPECNLSNATNHSYAPPTQQFRHENLYKLKQRWNLSFDGTEATNVHDFIYRLEHMARDDGSSPKKLTTGTGCINRATQTQLGYQ